MRESSIGIVIALLVTFGLGAGSIWWAYQFGFGSNSSSGQSLTDSTLTATAPSEAQSSVEQTPTPTATPTLTSTPQPVKKVDSYYLQKLPIREEVKFVVNTILITPKGREALEQLANTAIKYNSQDVVIRINVGVGESELSQTLAENRGQEIAGILRDKGFAKKIIISKKSKGDYTKATLNKPIEVEVSLINN